MYDYIIKCYEEYKIFMDIKENILPRIVPIMITNTNALAYLNGYEINNNPRNLYYNANLRQKRKDFVKAILFHEFTHLLDEIVLSKQYFGNDYDIIMSTRSEYQASQIELACKIGFKNIRSLQKINISNTFVPCEDKLQNIQDDYLQPMADALTIIDKPNEYYYNFSAEKYYETYKIFATKTMYYLGKNNFCKQISLSKIPDITASAYGEFYPFIHEIEKCILNKKYAELPQNYNKLFDKFLTTYPIKNSEREFLINTLS